MLLVSNGRSSDLSRTGFEDPQVYEMLHRADTIGIFQVESAPQHQTIGRIRPRNLTDMAHEVGTVRPPAWEPTTACAVHPPQRILA